MAVVRTGFQPRNTPAERRAFFDQQRRRAADFAALRDEMYYSRQGVANWYYAASPTPPPAPGELRTDEPITQMYLHKIDDDGHDRSLWFDFIVERSLVDPDIIRFHVRSSTGVSYEFRSNGTIIDSGDYYTIPVDVL
jgi:hypothetical protein